MPNHLVTPDQQERLDSFAARDHQLDWAAAFAQAAEDNAVAQANWLVLRQSPRPAYQERWAPVYTISGALVSGAMLCCVLVTSHRSLSQFFATTRNGLVPTLFLCLAVIGAVVAVMALAITLITTNEWLGQLRADRRQRRTQPTDKLPPRVYYHLEEPVIEHDNCYIEAIRTGPDDLDLDAADRIRMVFTNADHEAIVRHREALAQAISGLQSQTDADYDAIRAQHYWAVTASTDTA